MYADSGRRTPLPGIICMRTRCATPCPDKVSGTARASVRELITPEREKKLRLKTPHREAGCRKRPCPCDSSGHAAGTQTEKEA
eukprot:3940917-Rhodomonas_salina.1